MNATCFRILILVIGVAYVLKADAQSHDKGTVSFQLNLDLGAHGTNYTATYKGTQIENKDDGAATVLMMINASYNPVKFLSIGINTGFGSYLEDPENAEADGNRNRRFGLDVKTYYLNNDRFNMFLGAQAGASGLEINRKTVIVAPIYSTQQYKYTSPFFDVHTGFNWYFAKFIGMNMQLGYSAHNFKMKKATISGTQIDLTDYENRLKTRGIRMQVGASIKF